MNSEQNSAERYSPIWELTISRFREFYRVPEAIFWVYGFPLLIALALGVAFRNRPVEEISVDVYQTNIDDKHFDHVVQTLSKDEQKRFVVKVVDKSSATERLQRGKTDVVVVPKLSSSQKLEFEYWFEPNRSESVLAKYAVDSVLVRSTVADSVPEASETTIEAVGDRYIDFLIPGLIGMNLMGGGLWGVGFVTVDYRVRKLLKRFLATPMRKHHFLLSLMLSRLIFTIPEVLMILTFGWLIFGVGVQGNLLLLIGVFILGAASFSGLGLLIASRAKTLETISGLMNLVLLPMWVLSGVFFSSERFPDVVQPVIQALPLTALNDSIRGIMLEGHGITVLLPELAIVAVWGVVSFTLALRWFRWG